MAPVIKDRMVADTSLTETPSSAARARSTRTWYSGLVMSMASCTLVRSGIVLMVAAVLPARSNRVATSGPAISTSMSASPSLRIPLTFICRTIARPPGTGTADTSGRSRSMYCCVVTGRSSRGTSWMSTSPSLAIS